jgi:hypothetical protein
MLPPFAVVARRLSIVTAIASSSLLTFALAGCVGNSTSVPRRARSESAKTARSVSKPSVSQTQAVYVSDGGTGLFEYPINPDGTLGAPQALTLPRLGNPFPPNVITFGPDNGLYVVGHYANKVFFYQQSASGMWNFTYSLEPIYHSDSLVVDGKAYVYASGFRGSTTEVDVYPPGANGFVLPIVVIPGDSAYCCDVAVWAEQLYVSGNAIRVYATPYSTPVLKRTIVGPSHFGGPVALDKASELYVGNGLNVLAYSPFASGNVKPDRIIYTATPPRLSYEVSLALVGQTLYVYGFGTGVGSAIWVFDSQVGRQHPKQVVTGIGTNPLSMAIGPLAAPSPTPSPSPSPIPTPSPVPSPSPTPTTSTYVFVTNALSFSNGTGEVDYYPVGSNGDVAPAGVISGSNTGLTFFNQGIALNASGQIFVAVMDRNSILGFAPRASGNVSPIVTIGGANTGLAKPIGLAFDEAGNLYVANCSAQTYGCALGLPPNGQPSIEEFAAGSNGNVAPIRRIAGSRTGFVAPFGIAVADNGDIYLLDSANPPGTPPAIDVFAPKANGNVAPKRVITGINTKLDQPYGLALNRNGIYTGSQHAMYIERFGLHATGDVAPLAIISGSNTQLACCLNGMAAGLDGSVYVADRGTSPPSIQQFAGLAQGNVAPLTVISGPSTRLNTPIHLFVGAQP